jgi:hypothetical protein
VVDVVVVVVRGGTVVDVVVDVVAVVVDDDVVVVVVVGGRAVVVVEVEVVLVVVEGGGRGVVVVVVVSSEGRAKSIGKRVPKSFSFKISIGGNSHNMLLFLILVRKVSPDSKESANDVKLRGKLVRFCISTSPIPKVRLNGPLAFGNKVVL